MNQELLNAYRWQRRHYVGNVYPRNRDRLTWNPASEALKAARADVANGKARYPQSSGYGPAYKERGSKHMRWIEKPSTCGLRFVGYADKIAGLNHSGYYVDNDQNEIVRGVVFQMPGRNGHARFIAGYEDWNNGKADSDGPVSLDFGEVISEFVGSYGDDNAGTRDAARAADQIAEWVAESERNYHAAWQAGNRFAELGEEIAETKTAILDLIPEIRKAGAMLDTFPHAHKILHQTLCSRLADIRKARKERRALSEGDYIDEWIPGWNSRDLDLVAAFNNAAGITA
ncbi:hypothetical protein [Manganibacter manganicus]|uniref:Uncharacterized protein n=1 Tax=Manganibacter manganicus TaxID=1873176 RepID=A0A1V8RP65_9HYPH|nr:hypothetical protein [Pseudaminobacter manganicus]OQM74934.1 hypothetical protein BFN67_04785 [Pseudaminobacter manganicus]